MLVRLAHKSLRKNGFTLIELMMTIIVTGIIAVPLSLLLFQHVDSTFKSQYYTLGLNLARFEIEKVSNLVYATVTTGTFNFPNYNGYNYDVTRTVSYVPGTGTDASTENLKLVKVDAKKAGSATVLVSLQTYLVKNVTYGL